MKTLLYKTPWILLYSRLLAAMLMLVISFLDLPRGLVIALCMYAIASDLCGGFLIRRLKIPDTELWQMGTKTNTVFWFNCLFYLCVNQHGFLKTHTAQLFILVFLEVFIILFGLLKFRERLSFHTLLSKLWTLLLLWFFIEAVSGHTAFISFTIAFWYGIIAQLEILAIAVVLKSNETDMPGIICAIKFRKGIPLKRKPFF
jgi:hypothetical protein